MLTIETESKVRTAILHPVEEIRWTALSFYTKSFSKDAGIMPLVIEAIQQYGRGNAGCRLLREAERLPQTEATVRWLVDELSRSWDLSDPADDNYCYAAAMMLCNAPPELLWPEIAELVAFPEELRQFFRERFEMAAWDWETGWQALRDLVHGTGGWDFKLPEIHRAQRITESLARHRDKAPMILRQLEQRCADEEAEMGQRLEPLLVEVAGRMQLPEVAPVLVERLYEDIPDVTEACVAALVQIGGDATIELIMREWTEGDETFRMSIAEALEHIHTQRSVAACLELLKAEEDYEVTVCLAHALLGHVVQEAVDPAREILEDYEFGDEDADEIDLKVRIVAVATILGATFPEYEQWYEDSVATNWGWGDFQNGRVRNRVRRDYGLEPIDDSDEDSEDDLSPEEQREFASLWQRARDIDPDLFERMVNQELAEPDELEDYDEPLRQEPLRRDPNQVGRNDPCPCGSGKKYKKCCLNKRQS